MEDRELNLDELEHVEVSPNKDANYEKAMNNKSLYRKSQIDELQKLKEEVVKTQVEDSKTNTR